jgi:hypothetical protein
VGEQPTARQVVAAALIVIGEVVIAIFGDHTNDEDISVIEVVRYIGQSYLVWCISFVDSSKSYFASAASTTIIALEYRFIRIANLALYASF